MAEQKPEVKAEKKEKKPMRFRLLAGRHEQGGRRYYPGEELTSTKNLEKRFGREKFIRIHDDEIGPGNHVPDLSKLEDEELAEVAQGLGVSIGVNSRRSTIIARCVARMTGQTIPDV